MVEFTISFLYADEMHRAGVVKSSDDKAIKYDVRPITPSVVKKFGKQITIFREQDAFNTHNHIDDDYRDFFNALVTAIKQQDASRD